MRVNQRKAGVLLSYAGQAVQILTGLIYTPVMLRILGQNEYGLYHLIYSVVSYLSLLSLGFGSSYMRFYSREKANENEHGIAELNGTFLVIFLAMSAVCVVCGITMVFNIKALFNKGLTPAEYGTARILMSLLVVNMALTFPNSIFNNIITSQERFLFQKTVILLQHILNPFLALPLLLLGYGSIGMVSVTTALTLAALLGNMYYSLFVLKAKFKFGGLHIPVIREIGGFTFFIFLNQIIDQINWSVDNFLLGRLSGTAAVAVYGVGAQINGMYLHLSTAVSNVFIPKVNRIVAESDDNTELTKLFTRVGRIQFMIMMLVMSGFIFFGRSFIRFWAGEQYASSYYVTLLLIIPVTVPLIQNLGIEIQRAKNRHKARSVVYFFIAIANIFISIPLIRAAGPVGAAAGTAISLIAGNILFMNWYYHYRLGINMGYFWKRILRMLPGLVLPVLFGYLCSRYLRFGSFIKLGAGIAAYIVIYCLSIWLFGMNKDEKQMLMGFRHRKSNVRDSRG